MFEPDDESLPKVKVTPTPTPHPAQKRLEQMDEDMLIGMGLGSVNPLKPRKD